jgi:hypothetical protein
MFTGLVGSTETTVATLSAQEADLGSRARVHRLELASVTAAKRQAEDAATLAAAVDLAVADFDREAAKLVNRATRTLDAAGDAGVALPSLVKEGDSFKLVGSAATFDAPSEFAESLVRTGLFASANVLSVEKGGESVSFNMVAAFVSDVPKAGPLGEASSPAAVR